MGIIRAVAYPRYSSDNQREESITAQMRAIEDYCERKGYALVGRYPEEARSATTDNRPNFQRMIADSAKGIFDVVVVHKLDRFARDRYDSAFYKRQLQKNGVRVESVLEQFDDSPESVILESVLEGMAEYYSKNLARETRKGLLENAAQARHTGGRPPFGYRVDPDTLRLVVDERNARAVRFYFESVAAGVSLAKIADALNQQGYRTYSGRKFSKNSFWDWAQNKKYMGVFTWDATAPKRTDGRRNSHRKKPEGDQIQIPGAVPAIVSEELWEQVNNLMAARKHKTGKLRAQVTYLLSEKVFCGNCGALCRGSSYERRGKRFAYYKCAANCGYKSVRKNQLEEAVIDEIMRVVFTDEALREVATTVKTLYQAQRTHSEDTIQPLRNELAELQRKIDNWLDAIGDGLLDKNVLAEKIREASIRKSVLEAGLRRAEMMQEKTAISEDAIFEVMKKRKDLLLSGTDEERQQVVQEFVKSATVLHDADSDRFHVNLTVRLLSGVEEATPAMSLTRDLTLVI